MLERNELARALTELPDDLLLETERTARSGKVIKFRRLIAAAAVIALLGVTAGSPGPRAGKPPRKLFRDLAQSMRITTKHRTVSWILKSWNTTSLWR